MHTMIKRIVALVTATLLLAAPLSTTAEPEEPPTATGTVFYVAPTGADTADGSKDTPFATLKAAQMAAREVEGPVTLYLREGTYFMEEPLELTAADKGLTIAAYGEEEVTLSGAKELTGLTWTTHSGKILVAQTEAGLGIDQLFVNRQNQVLARYPNYVEGKLPLGGATTTSAIKARVSGYADPTGGYIRAIHVNGWGGNDYIITGKSSNNDLGLSTQWVGDNNRGSDLKADAVVIENLLEELDAPGEWYYDNQQGLLYYYPAEGIDPDICSIEAAVTTELIRITGESADAPVEDITLKGLTFFGTKRTMFTVNEEGKQYIPLLRGDWCVVPAGAVYMENGRHITVAESRFYSMGGNGIFMYNFNDSNLVDTCDFTDIGATAVQVVGNANAVYDPSFWEHDLYPTLQVHKTTVAEPDKIGPKTEEYPRDITIQNNHMENLGVFEKQSCGVNMSVSSRIKLLHNTIHKSARSGINVNDGTFGGHEIAYNDVFDCQLETTDHGQFNSWGRDRFWSVPHYNAAGSKGELLRHYTYNGEEYDVTGIDAYQTVKIHNNRFHHDTKKGSTWGIDLDDGSSNYEIYNNLCLGMGIKLREGFDRKVYNNIILDGQFQIHVSYTEARDEIYGNLVLRSNPYGFASVDENRFKTAEYAVDRNWYYDFDSTIQLPSWFAPNKADSVYDQNALIGVDPLFLNPYGNDYTVTNTEAMEQIGFENFPMTGFGQTGCECHSPLYIKTGAGQGSADLLQRESWQGATITGIDDAIMSSTASAGYNGVYMESVPADSPAYTMGLRTRDIIKQVNGVVLGHKNTFHTTYNAIPVGEPVVLTLHRLNETYTLVFIKTLSGSQIIECNDENVRYSTAVSTDLTVQNNWYYDARGGLTDMGGNICAYPDFARTYDAWVEVDFTGNSIEFISRAFTDQGAFSVVITDRQTGKTVVEDTSTCFSNEREYRKTVYTSPRLPMGEYTMRLTHQGGTYMVVDAFRVSQADDMEEGLLMGDLDRNGEVTAADALTVLQYATKKIRQW